MGFDCIRCIVFDSVMSDSLSMNRVGVVMIVMMCELECGCVLLCLVLVV